MLSLSQRDCDRLVVLHQVHEGMLSVSEGARRLRLGLRHMRRLLRRFETEGDRAVVHRSRGRRPNNAKAETLRERALRKARDPLYADFGPTLLSEHLARDTEIGFIHPATLRLWLIEEGLWSPKKQGQRHRRRRERRRAYGEMVLMDTSIHAWLEERSTEEIVLIAMIDDATSRLYARFFPRDTGVANRQLIVDYMLQHGRMLALYTDRASHFRVNFNRSRRAAEDQDEALTLIHRALTALEIELILALSPQAKGRVERLFKTLQDRLIKEMRIRRISSLEEANRFLEEEFIPFWNRRFTQEPADPMDAHRPLPEGVDLLRLFAETEERVIRADFTFRYKSQHYQIEKEEADAAMPKSGITIERRLDGTLRFRWRERYLQPTPLPSAPKDEVHRGPLSRTPEEATPRTKRPLSGAAGKPVPPTHPWRRFPIRVDKGRYAPAVAASASLRPDSPEQGEVVSTSP